MGARPPAVRVRVTVGRAFLVCLSRARQPVKIPATCNVNSWEVEIVLERPTLLNAQDTFQLPVHITLVAGIWVQLYILVGIARARMNQWNEPVKSETVFPFGLRARPQPNMVLTNRNPVWFGGFYLLRARAKETPKKEVPQE